jgi:hypothetical protein
MVVVSTAFPEKYYEVRILSSKRGDVDLGADARWVERHRIEPQLLQALTDGLVVKIGQRDALRARVGKGRVGGVAAAEFGGCARRP